MTSHPVSVVVVSHDRPEALHRCLAGICQLDYPNFEIVVVANAASRQGLGIFQRRIKLVHFETANISAARNLGIARAAGEIVAFIDDDAVPEPTWLSHLIAPFSDSDIGISGGFVIGRNGFSLQWAARAVDVDGSAMPLVLESDEPAVFDPSDGTIAKTEGTNMAVRKSVLEQLDGFDEAFVFYLDETDINIRAAGLGHKTAIIPMARVHHGFAASARRTPQRIPRDLTEIAASTAVFQRKHGHGLERTKPRQEQRNRLLRHLVAGQLMPGDVHHLLRGFDAGWQAGLARPLDQGQNFATPPEFRRVEVSVTGHKAIVTRFWRARSGMARAMGCIASGQRATLFLFSFSTRRHRTWFDPRGFWVQQGGQFGKSDRKDPAFRLFGARRRAAHELQRLSYVRPNDGLDT